jgi:peroxiredoxin family protein
MSEPLSLVVFSGTEDKLHAAATLAAGAAAMGRPVNVLLQFWGLDAFRSERIGRDRGLAFDAEGAGGTTAALPGTVRAALPWADTFRMAKELGDVRIRACSASLDYLQIQPDDLDPLVDECCGIASFFADAETGPITFI